MERRPREDRKKRRRETGNEKMAAILLVEDDKVLREGLTELFTRDGYEVVTAGNLREARERLASDLR